jgi:hypothetical protein
VGSIPAILVIVCFPQDFLTLKEAKKMSKIRQRRIRQLRRWLRKDLRVGRKKSKFLRRGRRP